MTVLVVSFSVPGDPVSWRRAVPVGRGRVVSEPKSAKAKAKVARHAHVAMEKMPPLPLGEEVDVTCVFHFADEAQRARADLDRHVNLVLDALTGHVYVDDRQVRSVHAWKVVGTAGAQTEISVVRS